MFEVQIFEMFLHFDDLGQRIPMSISFVHTGHTYLHVHACAQQSHLLQIVFLLLMHSTPLLEQFGKPLGIS